jgi:hypothetical protein
VWLNPPYARGLIDAFVLKLVDEVQAGRVSAAILLIHNYTDTGWFHASAEARRCFCLLSGRARFVDVFGRLGLIVRLDEPATTRAQRAVA